jgi:hypothetical protein
LLPLQLVFAVGDPGMAAQQLVPFGPGGTQSATPLAYKQIYQTPWASRYGSQARGQCYDFVNIFTCNKLATLTFKNSFLHMRPKLYLFSLRRHKFSLKLVKIAKNSTRNIAARSKCNYVPNLGRFIV